MFLIYTTVNIDAGKVLRDQIINHLVSKLHGPDSGNGGTDLQRIHYLK
jgi:hypothetical protein